MSIIQFFQCFLNLSCVFIVLLLKVRAQKTARLEAPGIELFGSDSLNQTNPMSQVDDFNTIEVVETTDTVETPTAISAPSTASTALPSGWETAQDSATGRTYYYNELTQKTCWEPPRE